ncbi:aminotransferase class III-fold pyridoxal phosphate-dependent enzyme [Pseudomonas kuykendallii]|uniref:Aspartate aminotransferase family protein n=1 Tax=Pseudomonas kuykendallii TaxID=1007099 RepID=A0A2W5F318_9PSED|nr:aminotransferase class III-fold pyridoxal phosphate-dependent enzyme [Pseudomonas kuykendallii]PZP25562.1 MAG: aspartate aminotransferase family protein [Pseudomonas kuykendallii]
MGRLIQTGLNAGEAPSFRIVGGEGVYFFLADGRRVIDGSSTGGPLGHAYPDMQDALRSAATAPVVSEGWAWDEREAAADELIDIAFAGEHDWVGGVRFFLSGSEANDQALSLAQVLSGRAPFATRERAYHGLTGLSRDATLQPHWHGGLASHHGGTRPTPWRVAVHQLPAPIGASYGGDLCAPSLETRLAGVPAQLADSAAMIIDYTQGGIYHDADYQDRMAAMARAAGSLWIADEVVTGLGRSGRWFAFQGGDSRPDIVTLGKPLAGGAAPAGAVVLSKEVMEQLKDTSWQSYSTFRAHPSMVAAVRAYLRVVVREKLLDRTAHLEQVMKRRLGEIAARHPIVARVDGRGLHWTIELHGPDWRDWRADTLEPTLASRVAERTLEAGALIGTSGEQTSLFLAPALIISDSELDTLLAALDYGLELPHSSAVEQCINGAIA